MTYTDFNDAGAHLSKPAWNHARKLLAEIFDRAIKVGADTKKVIYDKASA